MVPAYLIEGNFHDIIVEYKEEGGPASLQVSSFFGEPLLFFIPIYRSSTIVVLMFAAASEPTAHTMDLLVAQEHAATTNTWRLRGSLRSRQGYGFYCLNGAVFRK